ncbi:MAG: DUF2834 domain-containing protein [Anaerolineales bacterium]|nr:DUF2834 domain-containing protein [Anaerolineales bacterium]
MKRLYLALAIVGALIPWWYFYQFFATQGFDLGQFVSALFANGAVAGFTLDVFISSVVFWLFMFAQARKGGPAPYLFVALNLVFGLSCALPAYLYAHEK